MFVEQPRYLCNPVDKLGPPPLVPSGPPIFPEDHLACYDILGWPVAETLVSRAAKRVDRGPGEGDTWTWRKPRGGLDGLRSDPRNLNRFGPA